MKDSDGNVIETSTGKEPFSFIQGSGKITPGLEDALEGRSEGENLTIQVPPERGFGPRNDGLIQELPREVFKEAPNLKVGTQFEVQTDAGRRILTVVGVEEDKIRVDGNHPLAGATLQFDVSVREVREASPEELTHGHAHGPGAHAD